MTKRGISTIAMATCGMLCAPSTADAQGTPQPPDPTPVTALVPDEGLRDIVVTAQRIEERLQKVPVAVTAFDEEDMRAARITSIRDIAQLTPSFTHSEVNPGEPNFAIRGIGTEGINSNAGGDPSVVMFVDGVYIGRGGGSNLELFDLERVEVLRGPQGTLFGKNVVGGAISIISRRPSFTESFVGGDITIGNYDRVEMLARFNHAASDSLALSGAITKIRRDGYTFNERTGSDVDDENLWGARLSARMAPSTALDVIITADYTDQDQLGQPRDNVCDTSFQGGIHCLGINPHPRIVNAVDDGFMRRTVGGINGTVRLSTTVGEVTSITAYRAADYTHRDAFFSNPINPPTQIESINENIEKAKQFTQELRLASRMMGGRLRSVIGLYYLYEDVYRAEILEQSFPIPSLTGVGFFPQDVQSRSKAIFGQASFDVLRGLTLTAGTRMTWESKNAHLRGQLIQGPGLPPPLQAPYDITASKSWSAFTPRVAVSYDISDRIMAYASVARGFKSGGFQGTAGTGASAATPYDLEYAWNYEVGLKSRFLRNRVQLNVAAFRMDYTDLQVSQLVPLCCVVIGNAADARIDGAEVEISALVIESLRINGSYSWLDARFSSFTMGATADHTGNRLPRAPKHQLNLAAQYEAPISGTLGMMARVGWSYQSRIFFEASNTPFEVQEGYTLLDGRLAIRSLSDRWEFAVWGRNLTNELVKNHIVAFAPFRQELNTYQPPRTIGATLSVRFSEWPR